jgi:hypothetical protein
MDSSNLPGACALTDAELQQRRREVLQKARSEVTEVREIEDGFMYRFSATTQLAQLANLVELEHKCCPFLKFRITVEPADGPIWLELTGPEGTKAFLAELFESDSS